MNFKVGDVLVFDKGHIHHYEVTEVLDDKVMLKLVYSNYPEEDYEDYSDINWLRQNDWHFLTPLEHLL